MICPALVIILLDQISKAAIVEHLRVHEGITVFPGFFSLVHARNRGMAFGLLNRPDIHFGFFILVGASLLAIVLLSIWFFKLGKNETLTVLALSFILGGALGNLIDRLRFGEVIDFLDFYMGRYHWPAFNVADSAITVGALLIATTALLRREK